MLRFLARFFICTLAVFLLSQGLLQLVLSEVNDTLRPAWLGRPATGLLIILNLPLWIIGKGQGIFLLEEDNLREIAMGLNAAFYGFVLSFWFGVRQEAKRKAPPIRRSVE